MAYPLLENPLGNKYWLDGALVDADSAQAHSLVKPVDDVTYYETVRIKDGVLLFFEDHIARLGCSVASVENFSFDFDVLYKQVYEYLANLDMDLSEGNLRIVLTKKHTLFHICQANIPSKQAFEQGISTNILKWERVNPNVKVFRGEYKAAVADSFSRSSSFGSPTEVLLCDRDGKLYEGSKSNLFVIIENKVYSAPDHQILIGITRKRVLESLENSNVKLVIGTFTLEELKKHDNVALFVSSTPFDILPVSHVEEENFDSVNNKVLQSIMDSYRSLAESYIDSAKAKM